MSMWIILRFMSESCQRGNSTTVRLDNSLSTPAFLVDRQIVLRNCDRMREKALHSGVAFRPHVKTHKAIEIANLQHGGRAGPITVSTLAEAEFFADAGFGDITYAVPIAPAKLERVAALAARVERLNIVIDSHAALQAIEEFHQQHGGAFDAFLKVDCGYHRAGVDPEDPNSVRLALAIGRSRAIRLHGLLTHAGHSYHAHNLAEIQRIAMEETAVLSRFRASIAGEGSGDLVRSVGSTPTASVVDRFTDCDEVRPGNYVFYDAFQATIGSCAPSDCAVSVFTSVVGSYPERGTLIIDAGALALSKDRGPDHLDPHFGYGIVCDERLARLPLKLVSISQEHGKIEGDRDVVARCAVGTRLRVIPNHSCLTAAMYDSYVVIEGDSIVGEWHPVRGW